TSPNALNEHSEIVVDYNDDSTSSDDDSYVNNEYFKAKGSGSTTTHVEFSQYDSFIFDLSNDQFSPTDRSDLNHEEFADELTHIMSLPELKCFKFKIEPELGNLTMDVVNDIFPTREPRVEELARAQHTRSSQKLFSFYPLGKSKL
ncbi:hypothetical protein Tco_0302151, partial [Tanacetum coccineum]